MAFEGRMVSTNAAVGAGKNLRRSLLLDLASGAWTDWNSVYARTGKVGR
jgi:hypothetical protein